MAPQQSTTTRAVRAAQRASWIPRSVVETTLFQLALSTQAASHLPLGASVLLVLAHALQLLGVLFAGDFAEVFPRLGRIGAGVAFMAGDDLAGTASAQAAQLAGTFAYAALMLGALALLTVQLLRSSGSATVARAVALNVRFILWFAGMPLAARVILAPLCASPFSTASQLGACAAATMPAGWVALFALLALLVGAVFAWVTWIAVNGFKSAITTSGLFAGWNPTHKVILTLQNVLVPLAFAVLGVQGSVLYQRYAVLATLFVVFAVAMFLGRPYRSDALNSFLICLNGAVGAGFGVLGIGHARGNAATVSYGAIVAGIYAAALVFGTPGLYFGFRRGRCCAPIGTARVLHAVHRIVAHVPAIAVMRTQTDERLLRRASRVFQQALLARSGNLTLRINFVQFLLDFGLDYQDASLLLGEMQYALASGWQRVQMFSLVRSFNSGEIRLLNTEVHASVQRCNEAVQRYRDAVAAFWARTLDDRHTIMHLIAADRLRRATAKVSSTLAFRVRCCAPKARGRSPSGGIDALLDKQIMPSEIERVHADLLLQRASEIRDRRREAMRAFLRARLTYPESLMLLIEFEKFVRLDVKDVAYSEQLIRDIRQLRELRRDRVRQSTRLDTAGATLAEFQDEPSASSEHDIQPLGDTDALFGPSADEPPVVDVSSALSSPAGSPRRSSATSRTSARVTAAAAAAAAAADDDDDDDKTLPMGATVQMLDDVSDDDSVMRPRPRSVTHDSLTSTGTSMRHLSETSLSSAELADEMMGAGVYKAATRPPKTDGASGSAAEPDAVVATNESREREIHQRLSATLSRRFAGLRLVTLLTFFIMFVPVVAIFAIIPLFVPDFASHLMTTQSIASSSAQLQLEVGALRQVILGTSGLNLSSDPVGLARSVVSTTDARSVFYVSDSLWVSSISSSAIAGSDILASRTAHASGSVPTLDGVAFVDDSIQRLLLTGRTSIDGPYYDNNSLLLDTSEVGRALIVDALLSAELLRLSSVQSAYSSGDAVEILGAFAIPVLVIAMMFGMMWRVLALQVAFTRNTMRLIMTLSDDARRGIVEIHPKLLQDPPSRVVQAPRQRRRFCVFFVLSAVIMAIVLAFLGSALVLQATHRSTLAEPVYSARMLVLARRAQFIGVSLAINNTAAKLALFESALTEFNQLWQALRFGNTSLSLTGYHGRYAAREAFFVTPSCTGCVAMSSAVVEFSFALESIRQAAINHALTLQSTGLSTAYMLMQDSLDSDLQRALAISLQELSETSASLSSVEIAFFWAVVATLSVSFLVTLFAIVEPERHTLSSVHRLFRSVPVPLVYKSPTLLSYCLTGNPTSEAIEQQAREAQERSQTLLEGCEDCVIISDSKGIVIAFNKASENVLGWKKHEIIGRSVATIIPERLAERHTNGFERYRRSGVPHIIGRDVRSSALRKDGTEVPVVLKISQGEVFGQRFFTAFIRDITDLLQLEQFLETERARTRDLLLNVLPPKMAEQLEEGKMPPPEAYDSVTIFFLDMVSFTTLSSSMSAEEVVVMLDELFTEFDALAEKTGVQKIKTIGDAYMAVAGAPERCTDHAQRMAEFAVGVIDIVQDYDRRHPLRPIQVRIGMHSGAVVAGVIGRSKFTFDIWGQDVRTASKMESSGVAMRICVSDATRALLDAAYTFERHSKTVGDIQCWLLGAARTPTAAPVVASTSSASLLPQTQSTVDVVGAREVRTLHALSNALLVRRRSMIGTGDSLDAGLLSSSALRNTSTNVLLLQPASAHSAGSLGEARFGSNGSLNASRSPASPAHSLPALLSRNSMSYGSASDVRADSLRAAPVLRVRGPSLATGESQHSFSPVLPGASLSAGRFASADLLDDAAQSSPAASRSASRLPPASSASATALPPRSRGSAAREADRRPQRASELQLLDAATVMSAPGSTENVLLLAEQPARSRARVAAASGFDASLVLQSASLVHAADVAGLPDTTVSSVESSASPSPRRR